MFLLICLFNKGIEKKCLQVLERLERIDGKSPWIMLAEFGSGHASVNMYLRLCVLINCVCLCVCAYVWVRVIFLIFTCFYSHPTASSQVCRKSFPLDTFDLKRDTRWAVNFTAREFTILNFYSDLSSTLPGSIVTLEMVRMSQWNCYLKVIVNSIKSYHHWFYSCLLSSLLCPPVECKRRCLAQCSCYWRSLKIHFVSCFINKINIF